MVKQRPELLAGLKAQLPEYLGEVSGLAKVNNIYQWWRDAHGSGKIPVWVELERYVLALVAIHK